MILTVDGEQARQTAKRQTADGWHVTYLGANRHTKSSADTQRALGALYPVAFLVEKVPGMVLGSHFHRANQFQVVVGGSGTLGTHAVAGVSVHFTGPYSPYGPICASAEGLDWFTLRNSWDPGASFMPEARLELREHRGAHPHREVTSEPMPLLPENKRVALAAAACLPMLAETEDGLGGWRYLLPPGGEIHGPDPATGAGQYWLVLAGSFSTGEAAPLPPKSCIFVPPDAAPLTVTAGSAGAEALCVQFPGDTWH